MRSPTASRFPIVIAAALAVTVITAAAHAADDGEKAAAPASAKPPVLAVAQVKLHGDLADQMAPDLPFGRPPLTYRAFLEILKKAETDPAIQAVLLEPRGLEIGAAKVQGIREALGRLRHSGKKVYVFAEDLDTAGMVIAASADRVVMPESGTLALEGPAAEVPYLKGLFDLLGIQWLVVQEKEYKTAFEGFVRDRMSPAMREELTAIIDQRYEETIDAIALGRRIAAEKVREAIDRTLIPAAKARELGLVDRIQYRDQFEEDLRKDLGGPVTVRQDYGREAKELDVSNPFALFGQMVRILSGTETRKKETGPRIALIYAEGTITSGKSQGSPFGGDGMVGSDTLVKAIDEAAGDDGVKAIVLRIDSPGGSGAASDMIWRALVRARERKPVIASMSDVAASGGYYIAMAAQTIVAEPGTLTGSIGVIAARPSLARLLGFWGVRVERVARGKNAGLMDIFSDPDDAEKETLTSFVADFYKDFVAKVAKSRALPVEEVEKVARGRVWTGAQARERKLVDELGGLERAIEIAREKAGIDAGTKVRISEMPSAPSFLESLTEGLDVRAAARIAAALESRGGAGAPSPLSALLGFHRGKALLARALRLVALCDEGILAITPIEIR
jgi:protease IV